jgi:hypothetical protein
VEGQEPDPAESELVASAERTVGIHRDVQPLLHRHAPNAQRAAAGAMDAIVARFAEAPAIGDE